MQCLYADLLNIITYFDKIFNVLTVNNTVAIRNSRFHCIIVMYYMTKEFYL